MYALVISPLVLALFPFLNVRNAPMKASLTLPEKALKNKPLYTKSASIVI
jgi:hypothetical protein